MTEGREKEVMDEIKVILPTMTNDELRGFLTVTRKAYENIGGDFTIHLMQVSIIKNEMIRRGMKTKPEADL